MDPLHSAGPEPRSLRALLAEAWRLYRLRPLHYFGAAAVALMLAWTLDLILQVWTIGDLPLGALDDPRAPAIFAQVGRIFAAGVANGMIYALLGFAAQGIVARDVVSTLEGRAGSLASALSAAAPRLPALAGATLLLFAATASLVAIGGLMTGVAAALGLTEGVLSGVLVGTGALTVGTLAIFALTLRWALFPQAVVLEGLGPVEAIGRSFRLTKGNGRIRSAPLGELYLVRAASLMLILIGLQLAAGMVGAVGKLAAGWLAGAGRDASLVSMINPTGMPVAVLIPLEIFSILLSAAVLPLGLVASTLLYLDVVARAGQSTASGRRPSFDLYTQGGNR